MNGVDSQNYINLTVSHDRAYRFKKIDQSLDETINGINQKFAPQIANQIIEQLESVQHNMSIHQKSEADTQRGLESLATSLEFIQMTIGSHIQNFSRYGLDVSNFTHLNKQINSLFKNITQQWNDADTADRKSSAKKPEGQEFANAMFAEEYFASPQVAPAPTPVEEPWEEVRPSIKVEQWVKVNQLEEEDFEIL